MKETIKLKLEITSCQSWSRSISRNNAYTNINAIYAHLRVFDILIFL